MNLEEPELATTVEPITIEVGQPALPRPEVSAVGQTMPAMDAAIEVQQLNAFYGLKQAVRDVSFVARQKAVTAIIGPSGSGKSTVLRSLNRMLEVVPAARIEGTILFHGIDIYGRDIDPAAVRRTIGMVFQQPNPFPTMSVYENVAAAARFNGLVKGSRAVRRARRALPAPGGAVGRGEGQPRKVGGIALGRPAAAALHCARARRQSAGDPDGRALLRAGSDRHPAD